MTRLLLAPALLFAACTDSLPPETDVTGAAEGQNDGSPEPDDADTALPLVVAISQDPGDCVDHTVRLVGRFAYADGTVPENVSCRFTHADGTVLSDQCFAWPSMEVGALVTLTVTDLDTGAVGSAVDFAQGPASFGTTLTVSTSGSTLSWDAHTDYGGVLDVGSIRISISPSANVIVPDPTVPLERAGSVTVTEPGTYTVTAEGSIQFGEEGGCGATAVQTIEVGHAGCGDPMHDH